MRIAKSKGEVKSQKLLSFNPTLLKPLILELLNLLLSSSTQAVTCKIKAYEV